MTAPLPDRLLAAQRDVARCADESTDAVLQAPEMALLAALLGEAAAALSGREAEIEQLRAQLAGCGVLAMCNTRESLEAQRCKPGDYGWSASLGEVIAAAEREIALREQLATAPQPGDGWRPIAEAPRDGRQMILLLTPSGWPQVAYSNTWWTAGFSVECKPTHWMPLPAAPSAKGV